MATAMMLDPSSSPSEDALRAARALLEDMEEWLDEVVDDKGRTRLEVYFKDQPPAIVIQAYREEKLKPNP